MYITLPLNLLGDLFLTLSMEGMAPWKALLQLHNENAFWSQLTNVHAAALNFGGWTYPVSTVVGSL